MGSGFLNAIYRPALFIVTILALLFMMERASLQQSTHFRLSAVKGFFLQDEDSTDPSVFDYTALNFGLINQSYDTDVDDQTKTLTQWQRFANKVKNLNDQAPKHVRYTVLYLGRHGQGFHNVAQAFYGTEAWDCYWSMLDGNDTVTWADAHLTSIGSTQAEAVHTFWKEEIQQQKIPTPQSYYVSPLHRCLETANITFSELNLPKTRPFKPTIKELLREGIGIHTCDRRSSRTDIRKLFPSFHIESNFSEKDPLWVPNLRESTSAQVLRMKHLLADIFSHDENTFISFTSHSGAIACILTAVEHRPFPLKTGAAIPVLVRVETIQGEAPSPSVDPWQPAPSCTSPPFTSS